MVWATHQLQPVPIALSVADQALVLPLVYDLELDPTLGIDLDEELHVSLASATGLTGTAS
jgi:hypothetical protein